MSSVSIDEILSSADSYYSENDVMSAGIFLEASLDMCESGETFKRAVIINELLGVYRKLGERDKALLCVSEADKFRSSELNTNMKASLLLNSATVFSNFSEYDKAIAYYKEAEKIYDSMTYCEPEKISALCNNLGYAYFGDGQYGMSEEYYYKAVGYAERTPKREILKALTYLNLADLYDARGDGEKVRLMLSESKKLLEKCEKRDGEYAYACLKASSVFSHYGDKDYGKALEERSEEIYEGFRTIRKIL
ncbi:MAG: tetratricopeptide repeat protein [Firmicutes bacterium]|nr:tetratricopeptide repeat protein [Candidatus Colimorpha enterica]